MMRRVVVEPHDPRWAQAFDLESSLVARALGPQVVAVHHIGSTPIPGICAKPVIDMLVEVADIAAVDARDADMTALGHDVLGEFGIAERRYFRKRDEAERHTHHGHVFAVSSSEVLRHLAFRDFLIARQDWAERYSDLKRSLAQAHPQDIEAYMQGKGAFIREVDRRAATWAEGGSASGRPEQAVA